MGRDSRMQPWLKARVVAGKLVLGGRVVQIDVVLVGQHELDLAQRVLRPGPLAEGEGEFAGAIGIPIDRAPGGRACRS